MFEPISAYIGQYHAVFIIVAIYYVLIISRAALTSLFFFTKIHVLFLLMNIIANFSN